MREDPEQHSETKLPEDNREKIGFWIRWVKGAKKAAENHWEDSKAAWNAYKYQPSVKDGDKQARGDGQPFYWSRCKTIEPAYYSRTPKIVVKRRFDIDDPDALTASLIAERLGDYHLENSNFDAVMRKAVGDVIHADKATVQVVCKPELKKVRNALSPMEDGSLYDDATDGPYQGDAEVLEDDEGSYYETEDVSIKRIYLHPPRYCEVIHTPEARTEDEITEKGYWFSMTYDEAEARFGDHPRFKEFPWKSSKAYDRKDDEKDRTDIPGKFLEGWEIYDYVAEKVRWVCEDFETDFLQPPAEDIYGLRGFFPSTKFIISSLPDDSLYPTPAYIHCRKTLDKVDTCWSRFFGLLTSARRRALVDGSVPEVLSAFEELDDQEFISVQNLQKILEKAGGDISKLVWYLPVAELVQAGQELLAAMTEMERKLDEWIGTPDILRGTSDPIETAEAQGIKSNAAHDRFKNQKKQVQELARDALEMLVDVSLGVWDDAKIAQIVGHEFMERGTPGEPPSEANPQGTPGTEGHYERFPRALALLRNDEMRLIRLDIETDSTSFMDDAKEAQKVKLIGDTVLQGLGVIGGIQNPEFADAAVKVLFKTVESLGGSHAYQDEIRTAYEEWKAARENPPEAPPPPPDYEMMKLQIKEREVGIKELQVNMNAQGDQFKAALDQQKQAFTEQLEQAYLALEQFKADLAAQETMLEEQRLAIEAQARVMEAQNPRGDEKGEKGGTTVVINNPSSPARPVLPIL